MGSGKFNYTYEVPISSMYAINTEYLGVHTHTHTHHVRTTCTCILHRSDRMAGTRYMYGINIIMAKNLVSSNLEIRILSDVCVVYEYVATCDYLATIVSHFMCSCVFNIII